MGVCTGLLMATVLAAGYPQRDVRRDPEFPVVLGTFRKLGATGAADGQIQVSYSDSVGTLVDVLVYRVPPVQPSESDSLRLRHVRAAFVASVHERTRDDRNATYEVVVDTARWVATGSGRIPYSLVVVVSTTEAASVVSFAHFFLLGDRYVRVHLTLPSDVWQTSRAPNFALDLIRQLYAQPRDLPPLDGS